jgi:4-hydroxybenzoate polyprenyltransferase
MAIAQPSTAPFATLLKLGRVSNLPTVWTNVLGATVLAGGNWQSWRTSVMLAAMSLFYIGGMYLNDYFDRAIDALERPERPIPAGEISAPGVAAVGFGMLAAGAALTAVAGFEAFIAGIVLAAVIVGYDIFHKNNPVAPVVMGLCRALVYCGAAIAAVGSLPTEVAIAALAVLAYVAGLTYAARQENLNRLDKLWPLAALSAPAVLTVPALLQGAVPAAVFAALVTCMAYAIYLLALRPMPGAVSRAVGILIAGISLVDAVFLAREDAILPSLLAAIGFVTTLACQRYIAGT